MRPCITTKYNHTTIHTQQAITNMHPSAHSTSVRIPQYVAPIPYLPHVYPAVTSRRYHETVTYATYYTYPAVTSRRYRIYICQA